MLLFVCAALAQGSAEPTARELLAHLAAGELEQAAAMSNAPQRRLEILREYRDQVGEAAFRRVYARYLERPLAKEIALGAHHLLIWRLDDQGHLGGQYYVEQGGRYLLDDIPSPERARLQQILQRYRKSGSEPD